MSRSEPSKPRSKRKKLLAIASAGGHWTQLTLLKEAFDGFRVSYVTTQLHQGQKMPVHTVLDADSNSKLKLFVCAAQVAMLIVRIRPDVVFSTGAAPGYFAILFGKLIGAHTVWLDSMANQANLSMAGALAKKHSDLILTQWPEVANESGDDVKYWGSLI